MPEPAAGGAVPPAPVRDAATILLVRRDGDQPAILMGQRGASAAFMPNKYVFPGGAVDAGDAAVPLVRPLAAICAGRLGTLAPALAAGAVRELWEETGLMLAEPGDWPGQVPDLWQDFAAAGVRPTAAPLTFVFRAITPPGRPRRFDARFFLADAADVVGDPDDFSRADAELSHLHWVPVGEARRLNLPFITEVVLGEIAALIANWGPPETVPFFDNSGDVPTFRRIA